LNKKWGTLSTPELTPKIEADLKIIKLRNVLDRSRHYKTSDANQLTNSFEVAYIAYKILLKFKNFLNFNDLL
jgi:hypothetical protein